MVYHTHQLETGGEVWACSWAHYHVAATHRVLAGHVWVVRPCFPWAVRAGCSGWHQSPHTHQRHHHTLRGLDNHVLSHYHIVREGREWGCVSHMTLNYYGAVQTRQYGICNIINCTIHKKCSWRSVYKNTLTGSLSLNHYYTAIMHH